MSFITCVRVHCDGYRYMLSVSHARGELRSESGGVRGCARGAALNDRKSRVTWRRMKTCLGSGLLSIARGSPSRARASTERRQTDRTDTSTRPADRVDRQLADRCITTHTCVPR